MTIGNIQIKNKYIWISLAIILAIVVVFIISWTATTSVIEVEVKNSQNTQLKYSFLNQSNNKISTTNTNSPITKQWLPVSSYESLTEQNYTSYYTIVSTAGFFSNTYIEAELKPESKREFVGNNPQECMNYVNSVLVTLKCGDLLANALVHIPATPTLPTFTTTTRGQGPAGFDEGVFQTKAGSFSLSQTPNSSEFGQTHILNKLGDNFKSTQSLIVPDNILNRSTKYRARPYKSGFIAYNGNYTEVMFFPNFGNQAENIANNNPQNASNPVSLDIRNETILTSYQAKDSSLVYLNTNGQLEAYTVNKLYSQILFCGENYYCMTKDGKLDIYELKDKRFIYLYSVLNVKAVYQVSNNTLLITNFGVINLDIPNKNGYLSYSFGEYKYNSSAKTTSNTEIVVNVSNPNGSKYALLINPVELNSDNIDKKVIGVEGDENIRTFSIYKNFITVVPNIPADFNNKNNTFDSTKVNQVNQQITNLLKESGIDLNTYKLNFTIR